MDLGRPLVQGSSLEEQLALILGLVFGRNPDPSETYIASVSEESAEQLLAMQPEGPTLSSRFQAGSAGRAGNVEDARGQCFLEFLATCLRFAPDERPRARDLLQHPFVEPHSCDRDGLRFTEMVSVPLQEETQRPVEAYLEALQDEVHQLSNASREDEATDTSDVDNSSFSSSEGSRTISCAIP